MLKYLTPRPVLFVSAFDLGKAAAAAFRDKATFSGRTVPCASWAGTLSQAAAALAAVSGVPTKEEVLTTPGWQRFLCMLGDSQDPSFCCLEEASARAAPGAGRPSALLCPCAAERSTQHCPPLPGAGLSWRRGQRGGVQEGCAGCDDVTRGMVHPPQTLRKRRAYCCAAAHHDPVIVTAEDAAACG